MSPAQAKMLALLLPIGLVIITIFVLFISKPKDGVETRGQWLPEIGMLFLFLFSLIYWTSGILCGRMTLCPEDILSLKTVLLSFVLPSTGFPLIYLFTISHQKIKLVKKVVYLAIFLLTFFTIPLSSNLLNTPMGGCGLAGRLCKAQQLQFIPHTEINDIPQMPKINVTQQ